MKYPFFASIVLASAGAASLGATSCTGPEKSSAAAPAPNLLSAEDAAIPSQGDADKDAEASINDANADAELEKLEKELEEGAGGGG